jgi:phosphohistidine phosphatase SixA
MIPMTRVGRARDDFNVEVMTRSCILYLLAGVAFCVLGISLSMMPGAVYAQNFAPGDRANSDEAWAALVKGDHVALIRHGNAPQPGWGDPPGFKIDDCKTQRNLDEQGRREARALGEAFRNRGVRVDRILSSPWCRCLETARLMAVGSVEESWALVPDKDRMFPVRLPELKTIISGWRGPGTLALVTHAATVLALLGFQPAQGEVVVLRPGTGADPDLVGRLFVAPQ